MIGYYVARIIKKLQISAVRNSKIHKTSKIEAGCQVVNVKMDRYSFCGYGCKIINCNIGAFVSIADNVVVGGARHPIEWVSTSPVFYHGRDSVSKKFSVFKRDDEKTTTIGNDVWIGNNVLIKGGVTIGDGAVVGMGSVVTKDIPSYEIWAGNPAEKIRDRFGSEVKDKLLQLKWWEWDNEKIQRYVDYIRNPQLWCERVSE